MATSQAASGSTFVGIAGARLGLAARASLLAFGWIILVDLWHLRPWLGGRLDGPASLHLAMGTVAVHAAAAWWSALVGPLIVAALHRPRLRWLVFVIAATATMALNLELILRHTWAWLLPLAAVVLSWGLYHALQSRHTRLRWLALAGCALAGFVAPILNAHVMVGTHVGQHQTLVVVAWLGCMVVAWYLLSPKVRDASSSSRKSSLRTLGLVVWFAVGAFAWKIGGAMADFDPRARFLVRSATKAAAQHWHGSTR